MDWHKTEQDFQGGKDKECVILVSQLFLCKGISSKWDLVCRERSTPSLSPILGFHWSKNIPFRAFGNAK